MEILCSAHGGSDKYVKDCSLEIFRRKELMENGRIIKEARSDGISSIGPNGGFLRTLGP